MFVDLAIFNFAWQDGGNQTIFIRGTTHASVRLCQDCIITEVCMCSSAAAARATHVGTAAVVTGNEIDAVVSSTVVAGIFSYTTIPHISQCPQAMSIIRMKAFTACSSLSARL